MGEIQTEGNIISFMVEPKNAPLSKSGKTRLPFSTNGFKDVVIDGIACRVSINVTCGK